MPIDPTTIIGEILGQPATLGMDPASSDYLCPYTSTRCIKATGKPLPVCSVWRGGKLIIICPNRLRERNLIADVLSEGWTADEPTNAEVAPEVQLAGFGNVDFVVADVVDEAVRNFVSVEAQTVDVTGSYRPTYEAVLSGTLLEKVKSFSLNWDNVYKRYMTQVIRKGFYHHHWNTKIVALMQDELFIRLSKYPFLTTKEIQDPAVNVVFLLYKYDTSGTPYTLDFDRVVGTSHANLSQAALYAKAPDREHFEAKILRSLKKAKAKAIDVTAAPIMQIDFDDEADDTEEALER